MRDSNISITPYHLLSILTLEISKGINKHATALFEGIIPEDKEDEYMRLALRNGFSTIVGQDDTGQTIPLFAGIIKELTIRTENGVQIARGQLISESSRMDLKPHIRTFQDTGLTYKQVLDTYLSYYPDNNYIMTVGKDQPIAHWLLQYRETDWQFTMRLASHFNSFLVAEYRMGGLKFFFGLPKRSASYILNPTHYNVTKDLIGHSRKKQNGLAELREIDSLCYTFTDREIYNIADPVLFHNKQLYIYAIDSKMKGGELIHQYTLKTQEGFKTLRQYNEKLTGASLSANITAITKDMVQIVVTEDENKQHSGAIWYPYSTVYSSPDGTGFYAMPEKGDAVRLYCPNEQENQAYVISAVHLAVSGARDNPDNKSFKTKYGKEVLLTPNAIFLTNNNGLAIVLQDGEGITISSDKAVSIQTTGDMNIASETAAISIVAPDSITMEQGGNKIEMAEEITVAGAQGKIQ